MALNQTLLERKTETLTTNGLLPIAQAVLATINYTPEALQIGADMLAALRAGRILVKDLSGLKQRATGDEENARQAARHEAVTLAQTARVLFKNNPAALAALGLQTRYKTVTDPETGEQTRKAVRPSRATADVILQWRTLFTNALTLVPEEKAELTAAGWPEARLLAALALVEAYSDADIAQINASSDHQAASNQFQADLNALRQWYSRANGLITIALKSLPPVEQIQLRELLGLNL